MIEWLLNLFMDDVFVYYALFKLLKILPLLVAILFFISVNIKTDISINKLVLKKCIIVPSQKISNWKQGILKWRVAALSKKLDDPDSNSVNL